MNTNPQLPKDISGYQYVVAGLTKCGDIIVENGIPVGWTMEGVPVSDINMSTPPTASVYRKMPCPNSADCDDTTGWKKKRDELLRERCEEFNRSLFQNPYQAIYELKSRQFIENQLAQEKSFSNQVNKAIDQSLKKRAEENKKHLENPDWYLRQAAKAAEGNKAATYDEGKPPLAYLPWAGIDEVAQVQAYGHKKYKDFYNYRKGMEIGRNLSCAIRHIRAYMEGEDLDKESGRNHLAHACCRLLFVLQNLKDGKAIDDRYRRP